MRLPPAINTIHNTLRQWYSGLEIASPLLRHNTPINNMQNTPQQTDGWTCGLHILLINLTTIFQGRIPTLIYTQHHAESLSRSHLNYVLTGELDTYVTSLIRDITNPTHRTPITYHTRRKTHIQPITSTHNEHTSPLPTSTSSRKRTHTLTQTQTLYQPTPLASTQNPQKSPSTQRHHPTHRLAHETCSTHSP